MDWQMPRMDGVTATATIRDRWPAIAVIGLSASTNAEVAQAYMGAGSARVRPQVRPGRPARRAEELRQSP